MNDAIIGSFDVYYLEMPLDSLTASTRQPSSRHLTIRERNPSDPAGRPCFESLAPRQVREDKGFYIPDIVPEEGYRANPEYFSAAFGHAEDLQKAKLLLDEALELATLMSVGFCDAGDYRLMQTETICKVIEKKLRKARNRIDRHDRCHTNLFLAYFDLNGRKDAAAE